MRPDDHAGWSATLMAARDNPFVDFLHWELTPAHVIYDVCDGYATHDEGMGPGNYSLDNAPLPHPWCTCLWYPDTHKTLDDIGRELKGWLGGESNPRLDAAFSEWDRELEGEGNSARLVTAETVAALGGPGSEDVSDEYRLSAKPGDGKITIPKGYNLSKYQDEIETAQLLHESYGGDIELLAEEANKKTPDYNWRKKLWELKGVSSNTSIDTQLRKALKQISDNPGGVVIDYSAYTSTDADMEHAIIDRLKRSAKTQVDIILLKDGVFTKVLRYKK